MPVLHDAVLAALRQGGTEPRVAQEAPGKHASLALVAAGFGVCLVPASARDWPRRGVALRPVSPGLPVVEMAAAWRAGELVPAARALVDCAGAALGEASQSVGPDVGPDIGSDSGSDSGSAPPPRRA